MTGRHELWYECPAGYWEEALPAGNGSLGAMVYGRCDEEIIQLNEETVWSGDARDRVNPDSRKHLEQIRELIRRGRIREAEKLAVLSLSGTPQYQRCYQTLGTLLLRHEYPNASFGKPEINGYRRSLDLEEAVIYTKWTVGGTRYMQRVFASNPDGLLVIVLECEGEDTLHFCCRLDRNRDSDHGFAADEETIGFDGGAEGMRFCGLLRALEYDGEVCTVGEHLVIRDATRVVLGFSAKTEFRCADPYQETLSVLHAKRGQTLSELLERHIRDYRNLYARVTLEFGVGENACAPTGNGPCGAPDGTAEGAADCGQDLPTDRRLRVFAETGRDPGLIALYFRYGRYLMIAGSREGTLPLTLQGIWNEDMTAPWDSKYTININLQMNYWPVDLCNLSECAEPYFAHLKRMAETGKETARRMYGCRGFVAHHNTDIHADTAPQDMYVPATYWVMGGAWLATHIYEHYLFTNDREFLEDYYEVLREAVQFFLDFLTEDEEGYLVTNPSSSPENTYMLPTGECGRLCDGPAMDNEILWQLTGDFLDAAKVLGMSDPLLAKTEEMRTKLRAPQIGRYGQLLEWKAEYKEPEPGHRHVSHLYGVFPGSQITVEDTPELACAARKSLEHRLEHGGGHTGWSRAWMVLLWDRFKDGRRAYADLKALIGASTYPNLMDFHPLPGYKRGSVFQLDGNMGGITGIAEMLVQSHRGRIELLPALPEELSDGSVKGLKVRGNAVVSLAWKGGLLEKCVIETKEALAVFLKYKDTVRFVQLLADTGYVFDQDLRDSMQ